MMTELMKAVRYHDVKNLQFERVPRPGQPGNRAVKVKVAATGICGSDLHVYQTGAYMTEPPKIMGHEFAGTVMEIGSGVKNLSIGDPVVGDSRVACGRCEFCAGGYPNLCGHIGFLGEVCEGSFAEEIVIDQAALVKIDPNVPFDMAALAEPLAVALHAFSKARITGKPRTLILGAGPIGALVHAVARLNGITDICVIDVSAFRRDAIRQGFPNSVVEPEGQYDLVFESSGAAIVVRDLLPKHLSKKGTLVMIGLFHEPVPFDFNFVVENEWNIRGCAAFSSELPEAVAMLNSHWASFKHVVSHRLPLAEYQKAFDLLLTPEKNAMKILFQPDMD